MNEKTIQCLSNPSQNVPIYLQQFPSYSNRKFKKSPFSRTAAHIFVSLETPLRLSRNMLHGWKDNSMLAKPLAACTLYLSIFNSFRVIRCLSQCISQKSLFSPHFCLPWGRPWGNHAKCCMDRKRIQYLQIVSPHVPIELLPFLRYSEIFVKKSSFYHTPLHSTPPLGGFPSEYRHPLWDGKTRMVSLPDGEKNRRYVYSF